MSAWRPARPRGGFTLIEALLALALTALIAAVLFLTYTAFQRGLAAVAPGADPDAALLRTLRAVSDDVECAFAGAGGEATLVLTNSEAGVELRFRAMVRAADEPDPAWAEAADIAYFSRAADRGAGWILSRSSRPALSAPDAPGSTSVVARGLAQWRPAAFDGAVWHSSWPATDAAGLPKAVRIEASSLQRPGTIRRVDVLIPAGQVVKPTDAEDPAAP